MSVFPPLPSYRLCSYGQYYFRMRVPKDLQPILKKRELKKVIKTTDAAVASRQAIRKNSGKLRLPESVGTGWANRRRYATRHRIAVERRVAGDGGMHHQTAPTEGGHQ